MPIADVDLVMMASAAVLAAQHFPHKVTDWEGRPAIDRTWRAWKVEFRQAQSHASTNYRHLEVANRLAELTPSSRHHPAPSTAWEQCLTTSLLRQPTTPRFSNNSPLQT